MKKPKEPRRKEPKPRKPPKPLTPAQWAFLVACADRDLPIPVVELQFCDGRKWAFDYAFPTQRVAVEVEGGVFRRGGGTHQRPMRFLSDMDKYNTATLLGWRVLRINTERFMTPEFLNLVATALL